MRNERQLTAIIWWTAIVWAAVLLLQGTSIQVAFFKPVSVVAGAVVLSLGGFDRWLWHWRLFAGWLVKRPDLRGTWEVELRSSWINPETGAAIAPIVGFLVISQTYSGLGIRLLTAESESRLRGAEILSNDDGTFDVVAVYQNEPKIAFRSRSQIHQGALKLSARGLPVNALDGHYWTDRNTNGGIATTRRLAKAVTSFEDAKVAFLGARR